MNRDAANDHFHIRSAPPGCVGAELYELVAAGHMMQLQNLRAGKQQSSESE